MITFLVTFLVTLMVSLGLTVVVRNRALAWGWVDQANSSRKVHLRPIPRLGGIAIVAGFFAPLCALFLVDSGVGLLFRSHEELVWGLFCGGAAIAVLGLYDDLHGTGARLKFSVQFAVAIALYVFGFRVELIANPFGPSIPLGALSLPFTLLWMVGVVNALNLIDGLDGLAGGVAFFGVSTNFILSLVRGDVVMCLLMLYGLCGLFTLTALGLNFANSAQSAMLLIGMGIVIAVLMRKLGYLDLRRASAVGEVRRKNIRLRSLVKQLTRSIQRATTLQELWAAVRPLAEALEVARLELRFQHQHEGLTEGVVFETQRPAGTALPLEVRIEVKDEEVPVGWLSLCWRDGRTEINRDEELALELVADTVAERAASLMATAEAEPGRVVALRR